MDRPFSRYGYTLCPAPGWLVRGFGYRALRPIWRISRWDPLAIHRVPLGLEFVSKAATAVERTL